VAARLLSHWRSALCLGLMSATCFASATDPSIAIVWTSGIAPFEEAVAGLRGELSGFDAIAAIDLKSPSAESDLDQLTRRPPRLIVAVGIGALTALKNHRAASPILATMVLRADASATLSAPGQRIAAVYLDAPIGEVIGKLHAVFPGKSRLGVIRNPARDAAIDLTPRQGFTIESRDCAAPDALLKTLLSLKRRTDFVLLQPDSSLYNEATAKPLLMASLENQLPVIGFSASFVRAGAAAGVYPDYKDIGEQTAELARRYLAGSSLNSESPRKLIVSVNQGVLRLLGLEYKMSPEFPVVVIK